MPTYTVHSSTRCLGAEQRGRLAAAITRAHTEATGAHSFLAQVMFVELPGDTWFIGGSAVTERQIYIHGRIRAGRSEVMKRDLLERLVAVAVAESGLPRNRVWAYLAELPAGQMAEYGHILPEPGTEAQWLAGLPSEDRAVMEATNTWT